MKKLFLIFSIFFSLNIFSSGNTSMVPVSTQKVANASLTCPTGKWCKVVASASSTVNGSQTNGSGAASSSISSTANSAEFILRSGEVISGSVSAIGASACFGTNTVTISISGTAVMKVVSSLYQAIQTGTSGCSATNDNSYYFYSMEYWN